MESVETRRETGTSQARKSTKQPRRLRVPVSDGLIFIIVPGHSLSAAMSTDHVAAALALVTQLKELMGTNQFAKAQELLAPIKVRVCGSARFRPLESAARIRAFRLFFFLRTNARSEHLTVRDPLLLPRTVSNQTHFGRSLSFNSPPRKTTRQNCGKVCSLVCQCLDQRLFACFRV